MRFRIVSWEGSSGDSRLLTEVDWSFLPRVGDRIALCGEAFGDVRTPRGEVGESVFKVDDVCFSADVRVAKNGNPISDGAVIEVSVVRTAEESPPLEIRCTCEESEEDKERPGYCDSCGDLIGGPS